MHFVYIVRCADGSLYTGYARDPIAREAVHNQGRGAKYTRGRRPVRLVYQEKLRTAGQALAREYALKQLARAEKEALVVMSVVPGRLEALRREARRRHVSYQTVLGQALAEHIRRDLA